MPKGDGGSPVQRAMARNRPGLANRQQRGGRRCGPGVTPAAIHADEARATRAIP